MNILNLLKFLFLAVVLFTICFSCSDNLTDVSETDASYIREVINNGYSSPNSEEDDLFFSERNDFDDGGAVGDFPGDNPIDSLIKWGRVVNNISRNISISSEGDTIKNVLITTNISGTFIIIGVINNTIDTIYKPYSNEFRRTAVFKRIARTPRPRLNWRLYKISMLDGETKTPQIGTQYTQLNQAEIFVNGNLVYNFTGPDFTQNIFTTKFFGGEGIPEVKKLDEVKIRVHIYSTQSQPDIVNWHWGRRYPGHHREKFSLISETPNGSGWDRIYEKSFIIGSEHPLGRFNGFVSSLTSKSLFDDSPSELAGDFISAPYRVKP